MDNIDNALDLSVIIPHYNDFEHLEAALTSLQTQKDINLEVIVVDDCSEEASFADFEKWRSQFAVFKLFKMVAKKGTLYCRLKGMELASAPYVTFLDADDLLYDAQAYAMALKPYMRKGFDIIHYNTLVKNKWGFYSYNEFFAPISQAPLFGKDIFSNWLKSGCSAHTVWNKFYSLELCRLVCKQTHEIKISRFEDLYLTIWFFLLAKGYLPIPDPVYKYQLPLTKSLEKSAARALDSLRMFMEFPALLAKHSCDEETIEAFKLALRMFITLNAAKMCEFLTDPADGSLDEKKLRQILRFGSEKDIFVALAIANGSNANKLKDVTKIIRYSW